MIDERMNDERGVKAVVGCFDDTGTASSPPLMSRLPSLDFRSTPLHTTEEFELANRNGGVHRREAHKLASAIGGGGLGKAKKIGVTCVASLPQWGGGAEGCIR